MSLYHLLTFHKNAECLFLEGSQNKELWNEFVKTVIGGILKDISSSQIILSSLIQTWGHKVSW